jgi:hypothetical protein
MISDDEAKGLCSGIVGALTTWPARDIALQTGGLEQKATCIIAAALEKIAVEKTTTDEIFLVLREYNKIDFSLVTEKKLKSERFAVDSVIEVKSNYVSQGNHIIERLRGVADAPGRKDKRGAIEQARKYRVDNEAKKAYVLYFLAAPYVSQFRETHAFDTGLGYWSENCQIANSKMTRIIGEIHGLLRNVPNLRIVAEDKSDIFCCILIDVSVE